VSRSYIQSQSSITPTGRVKALRATGDCSSIVGKVHRGEPSASRRRTVKCVLFRNNCDGDVRRVSSPRPPICVSRRHACKRPPDGCRSSRCRSVRTRRARPAQNAVGIELGALRRAGNSLVDNAAEGPHTLAADRGCVRSRSIAEDYASGAA
jgi:hypothetical protein